MSKFLYSDKTMKVCLTVTILCWVSVVFRSVILGRSIDSVSLSLLIASIIYGCIIIRSYATHDKNIMKPALGMLMGEMVLYFFVSFGKNIFNDTNRLNYFENGTTGYISFAADLLLCLLFFTFTLAHLAMNKTHTSSRKIVQTNEAITVALLVISLIKAFFCNSLPGLTNAIFTAIFYFGLVSLVLMICSIEAKIDYFRDLRAKGLKK